MDRERCTEVKVQGQPRYSFAAIGGVRAGNGVTAWLISEAFSPPAKSGSCAKGGGVGELCQAGAHGTAEQGRCKRARWGQDLQVVAGH